MRKIPKPAEGEYAPYAAMYIGLLPDDQMVLHHLGKNFETVKNLILSLPEEKLTYRYAENKWTIKEILVHIVDDERVYAYRALRFARNDKTELPGFDQDDYTKYSNSNDRSIESIFNEYDAVRKSTVEMFNSFDDKALVRSGFANGTEMSVRAAVYHIAGHELHHINIIKNKYL
ncbi:MAG: DinB family protein [Ignavibacteriaceae bacterium]